MNASQTLYAILVMLRREALAGQVMDYRHVYQNSILFILAVFFLGLPRALQIVHRYLDKAMLGGQIESNDYMYPKFANILAQFTFP